MLCCHISCRFFVHSFLVMLCAAVLSFIYLLTRSTAIAADATANSDVILLETANVQGLVHTTEQTILKLLPREIPAEFTQAEIDEFERRIRNLSLFDRVNVSIQDRALKIDVQEKVTLALIVNFTSGSVLQDLNATLGLVEYNLGGTGTQLGGQFNYSQRGINVDVWMSQHSFQPTRWAKEIKASYNVNGIRFADSAAAWNRNRIGSEFELKGPYAYGSPLRYEVVLKFYRELIDDQRGARPPDGYFIGIVPEATWDRYHWHDLVPRGYRVSLELRPGYFLGANQPRHEGRLRYLQGIPLAPTTVFMINGVAEAVNTGNPNHSVLIGSIAGVRGLSDNLYRNRAQTYANFELRHAIPLAPRWALQGVLFSDVGTFQSFTQEGDVHS